MVRKRMAQALCVMALLGGRAFAQDMTSTLSGTVVNASGKTLPGAQVELRSLASGALRDTVSGPDGSFVFNSLLPGHFSLTVRAAGFKTLEANDFTLAQGAARDVGKVGMSAGTSAETAILTLPATPLETVLGGSAHTITGDELANLTVKGRDFFALLATVPGVYLSNTYLTGGDVPSQTKGLGAFSINGGPGGRTVVLLDGILDLDIGSNSGLNDEPTMDTIAEIRVLSAGAQAQYGRNSDGAVSVVTKSGSQDFHGVIYGNKRHEMFNATSFFNNLDNAPKSMYRYNVGGFAVGGPIYLPKRWNVQKKRLFFFFSQEYTRQRPTTQSGLAMVPTTNIGVTGSTVTGLAPGQVQGDFYDRCLAGTGGSLSSPCVPGYTDGNGASADASLVNPAASKTPLLGGNLGALKGTSYYDSTSGTYGVAALQFLPPPNLCNAASGIFNGQAITPSNCPAGFSTVQVPGSNYQYNYFWSYTPTHPRRNDTARMDFYVTSKLSAWFRYTNDYDLDTSAPAGIAQKNSAGTWVNSAFTHPSPGRNYGFGATYLISPSMTDELIVGKSYNSWDAYPADETTMSRGTMGNIPSFDNYAADQNFTADTANPRPEVGLGSVNYFASVPQVAFGGGLEPNETPPAAYIQGCYGACPYTTWNNIYTFSDNFSRLHGKHNLQAGVYIERNTRQMPTGQNNYVGAYDFSSGGPAMTADTQDGFANAYLGNFSNYQEGVRSVAYFKYSQVEAYVQDTWRALPRLTITAGVRLYHMPAILNTNANSVVFVPSNYAGNTPPRLYYPYCSISTASGPCPSADQYAIDPVTGFKTFYSLQGTLVPAQIGQYPQTPTNGPGVTLQGTDGLPSSLYTAPGINLAPRFGFAWDVFGNGRTTLRGGAGIYPNRNDISTIAGASGQPPATVTQGVYNNYINSIATLSNNLQGVSAIVPVSPVANFIGHQKNQTNYNGSLMVQQSLGFSTVLEAGWVFNLARHLPAATPYNYMPFAAQYNSAWVSPVAQYLLNPAKNGGLTQGNAAGLDLSPAYFYGPTLCRTCLAGLSTFSMDNFDMSSDTNALQISLRRNMTKHLLYGVTYNLMKTMNAFGNGGGGVIGQHDPLFSDKARNWGPWYLPAPQTISFDYVYEVPNLGEKFGLRQLGWVTDHWTISGITQWRSEARAPVPSIAFSGSNATSNPLENWTGSSDSARMFVVGNYRLSSVGQQVQHSGLGATAAGTASTPIPAGTQNTAAAGYSTAQYGMNGTPGAQLLNEAAFRVPFPCSGTAAANPAYGVGASMECYGNAGAGDLVAIPGSSVLNFDATISKAIPLKSDRRSLVIRAEFYNALNHTNFSAWDITPGYDWNNWKNGALVQTNSDLGHYTQALNPRQVSLGLRLRF